MKQNNGDQSTHHDINTELYNDENTPDFEYEESDEFGYEPDYYDEVEFEDVEYYTQSGIVYSEEEQCRDDESDPFEELCIGDIQEAPDIPAYKERLRRVIERVTDGVAISELDETEEVYTIESILFELLNTVKGSPSLFAQLSGITRECLIEYGFYEEIIDSGINNIRRHYINDHSIDKLILNYIVSISRDESHKDDVSVLPLICGAGKSTAITALIIRTIKRIELFRNNEYYRNLLNEKTKEDTVDTPSPFDGLLIVTDSKERLKSIWSKRDNLSDKENEFIASHAEEWVTVMTEENFQEAENEQKSKAILLITTQRYFSWTKDEIKEHLKWDKENNYRRSMIIFDEMPYLNEVRDISIKTLNDIDSALWLGLNNEVNLNDKLWCIEQWEKFRDRFSKELLSYEIEDKINKFYYESNRKTISDDDRRFLRIIKDNKNQIKKNYSDEYQNIFIVKNLLSTWGIFSHRDADTGAYENKITVFVDNREKMTQMGAKIIILDGTGNVSPIYDKQDYIYIHSGRKYIRSLSSLTIKLGDYGTSRVNFLDTRNSIAPHIKYYLQEDGNNLNNMFYFTYKKKRAQFGDKNHTAHFGDIKGKNEFKDATVIAQIGLNSLQPPQYLAHILARNKEMQQMFPGKSHEETEKMLEEIVKGETYLNFMTRYILADIDQCLFRSAIRQADNRKDVTYYLFYSLLSPQYKLLTKKIIERYNEFFKCQIVQVKREEIDLAYIKHTDNTKEKIFRWIHEQWNGMPIKKKEVMNLLNIKESTFDSTVRRHFEQEFIDYKRNAKSLGCPNGYYAKSHATS